MQNITQVKIDLITEQIAAKEDEALRYAMNIEQFEMMLDAYDNDPAEETNDFMAAQISKIRAQIVQERGFLEFVNLTLTSLRARLAALQAEAAE